MIVKSETDISGAVYSFSFLDIGENAAQFERVTIFLESIGAFQIEPEKLSGDVGTCSTLHFICGTSSLTDFSLRQVMKLSSRKLHYALGNEMSTDLAPQAAIAYPWLVLLIIKIDSRLNQ